MSMSTVSAKSDMSIGPAANGTVASGSASGDSIKRRRRSQPFKRSKTGCGTCKKRGKKCDEEWSEEGWCKRCVTGGWDCSGRSAPRPKSTTPTPSNTSTVGAVPPQVHSLSLAKQQQQAPPPPGSLPQHPPSTASSTSPTTSFHHPPSLTSILAPSFQSLPQIPTPSSTSSNTISTLPTDPISQQWSFPQLTSNSTTTTQHIPVNHTQNTFNIPSQIFQQPLYDWPSNTNQAAPSAFLTTCSDGSLAIDTSFPWNIGVDGSGTATTDLWDDFDRYFSSTPQNNIHTPVPPQLNSGSRVLFLSGDRPMRQGVSLAEIYARVVESWLVGLPSNAREYARARIMALNDNNSVMRAVRYAVATAYIFLFASQSSGSDHPDPTSQPKLVQLAYRGAGVVNQRKTPDANTDPTAEKEDGGSENAIRRIRLYVDHVSTPYAGDVESRKWTEDAIQELRQVVITDKKQLSDLLWGVIDLQLVEFIRGGAAPSYNMLALGDRLVQTALGEAHPALTLGQLRTSETFSLRLYALSDISRCIVHRGRRTIFNFWTEHGTPDVPDADQDEEFCWSAYLGLPDSIVIILAEVVNLCADMSSTSHGDVKAQAEELEQAIRSWQPFDSQSNSALDATAVVSRTIAGQMWRLCALILLYQSVHRVGSLHPVLRQAQGEMLSLLDSVIRLPNGDLWGFLALPAFLAATLSITESDRKRSIEHMKRPGPERMWLDNIALVEKVWEEVDGTGRPVDWYDKLQREGMSIAFF